MHSIRYKFFVVVYITSYKVLEETINIPNIPDYAARVICYYAIMIIACENTPSRSCRPARVPYMRAVCDVRHYMIIN